MNEIEEDLPPVKDFGPEASLRRRRFWGIGLMIGVLGFLGVVTFVLGDGTNCSDGCMNFGNSTNEAPPVWLFMVGVGVILCIAVFAPILADKLPKIEEND
ncbi:MAG: hypothetical protein HOF23_03975 [Rhodospirillaceae bacterium]|nr:hypothetical protein [Rhodospirillaceae bacterium]